MGKLFTEINDDLKTWIEKQKVFFVSTAPLSANGHINCSPKGLDSLRIFSPDEVAYQDLTGSGIETIAHIKENKRIVIMFCAFEGPPKIVRLYGNGEIILPGDSQFSVLHAQFPLRRGTRAYIKIQLTRISDSCGYGVPLFDFNGEREVLTKWADAKTDEDIVAYRQLKNSKSIDGLAGL